VDGFRRRFATGRQIIVTPQIQIDPAETERYILKLAQYGAYEETGVWRTVYSPEWIKAKNQFVQWCEEAGLEVSTDAVGNVWGRLGGTEGGPSIVSGSHIDTQRPGGRYDGALGAIAALVAIKALKAQFGRPRCTLEVVAFCEEEGSRFPAASFWGSRAVTGRIAESDPQTVVSFQGEPIGKVMEEVGLDPRRVSEAARSDIDTFLELHIEQGPILEQAGIPVAVVDGITGIRHYSVELRGKQNHAGAFPMDLRQDPMAGFAEIASGVINTAHRMGRPAVTTVGRVQVEPNAAAVIPASVAFSIDARHPDPQALGKLIAAHERLMREVAERRDLEVQWTVPLHHAPCPSDEALVAVLRESAADQSVPCLTMASGAGHDTQQMAAIAKVAMVFVRSKDGRSHTPEEFSSLEDIVAGIKVLAAALYKLAYR
jgi:allantoate deiminase